MGEPANLAKAQLVELDASFKDPAPGGKTVAVQFNPESLKLTFANRTEQQQSAGDQRGNSPRQVVGAGATKLALQLWFDATAPGADGVADVRELADQVTYFMMPKAPPGGGGQSNQPVPPGVRFLWGTFKFDGMMDSLEETLDFFSPDGRPLRAQISLGLSGQIEIVSPSGGGALPAAAAGPTAGTRPQTAAPAGSSLPDLASAAGAGPEWQAVAAANGIENPRLLAAGQLLDLEVGVSGAIGVSAGVSVGAGIDAEIGVAGGFSAGIDAGR